MNATPPARTLALLPLGDAARRVGISTFRARFYADRGFLGPVARSEGRVRMLSESQLLTLADVAAWRRQGFTLREIAALLRARTGDRTELAACARDLAIVLAQRGACLRVMSEVSGRP